MADSVLSSVAEKKTAREIWDVLNKLYEVKSLHTRIFLKRKLYTLRMSESTSVTDHINTLNTLCAQLTASNFKIAENESAELLLQSLPDSYDQLIINITNNNVGDSLHFDDVAGAILEEESKRKNDRLPIEPRVPNVSQAPAESSNVWSKGGFRRSTIKDLFRSLYNEG